MSRLSRRIAAIFLIIVAFVMAAGCSQTGPADSSSSKGASAEASAYPLEIKDSHGRTVVIEKKPERVVSIAPGITESIFAIGKGEVLVGRTDYCTYPKETDGIESIGGMQDPNIEKIVELDPDIVIASAHFKEETLEKLEELGLKVVVLYGEESFEGVYDIIGKLGTILDAKANANELTAEMESRVAAVKAKVNGLEKPSVYYVIGFGEYGDFTAGSDTFISKMIEMAGGTNAASDVKGWKYSLERLVENDPDILICSSEYSPSEQVAAANGYKELSAVKNGSIFTIETDTVEIQGPRQVEGLEELARIIHPEAFK
ncbi:ABC-type Fe3+-hydroxamate transport system, periplasmic component YvrC [Peptoclostridium acidaminophilum DSM 3953]|uniref:ABC-type Fe3+-hydroxamate transport system, periplasmic component YvrC n=1 Tax=Peptoclostridium acidaminophilum DSM 3953 TaxID=1286171 RepID=W8T5F5_PEPAC|nr:ABC transporter substrate-binding protein [Peptoclostridium acidaminophilum]AHM56984.1 ABC-type Fe3+-hydroxamate transport system, periplasmic component YvrC [Peptoclostridium acidaminophilum DSM 3953]